MSSGLPCAWTRRIALRPSRSGRSTTTWRSNRPGRSSAGSRMSGRLVAAIRITVDRWSNPSISTSSWFRVCSRSSCPPPSPAPRWRPDGVDLVDEDDRGRARLRLLEQVAHARRADAHEHLHEVRAADREERHAGLAGDGARQQRLAGAGRPEQQHPARDLRAHRLELRRVLEVLLDLLAAPRSPRRPRRRRRTWSSAGPWRRVLCLLRPNCITRPPPPCERFITNSRMPPISSTGRNTVISVDRNALGFWGSTSIGTPALLSSATSSSAYSAGYFVRYSGAVGELAR